MDDLKQRLAQLIEDRCLGGSRAEEVIALCRDARAEIERLEFALAECQRGAKLYRSALRSR